LGLVGAREAGGRRMTWYNTSSQPITGLTLLLLFFTSTSSTILFFLICGLRACESNLPCLFPARLIAQHSVISSSHTHIVSYTVQCPPISPPSITKAPQPYVVDPAQIAPQHFLYLCSCQQPPSSAVLCHTTRTLRLHSSFTASQLSSCLHNFYRHRPLPLHRERHRSTWS
jgi:hypothetical protein